MDNAISYCAALKGFQEHSSFQLDGSFQQLLTHATMLDFVLEESNHEGLSHILQGLDKGIEEFLESLEELPFTLRNTQSFISTTSDILWAKSALLGVAGQLTPGADNMTLKRVMKRCQHERDMLLRAIRVFFDIADFESRLQTKLSIKETSNTAPSPKRKIRFRPSTLTRRQSNAAQQSKPRDAPPIIASIPSQPQSKGKEEEDEYNFHVAIVSDVVTPLEWDQYWGVSMPDPVGEAADVLFSEESGSMQGASLIALVYILTDPQPRTPIGDDDLLDTFLLCFRGFCDPVELAKALLSRYEEQPGDLNDSQREAWPAYQSSIKARVLGLINTWVDQYWVHEKDCIAGLHLKDFVSLIDEEFAIDERAEIVRKLNERREEAVSPAASGDSVDQSQSDLNPKSSSRVACRQTPIQYRGRLQVRVQKFIRKVTQPTPTDVELQSAKALDDLIYSNDGNIHILDLNSREFCQDLARQLALFMSEGYLRVMPEDLWYRFGLGHGCDSDTARIAQQTYESALSSWVTGSILDQVEAETRAAVMTFFIALALRSHEYHNYSAMRSIYEGLTHPCLASLSDMHLPLDVPTSWALDRLSELRENIDGIAITGRGVSLFPQPAVPAMEWYLNAFGNTINAKPHLMSPNSQRPIANMGRCFNVVRIIREMEHWHVPYNYPRADHVQAWLLKSLEGAIARDADKQCDWMFRQSEVIEKTGRPESAKQKLPRLSNPFGRRNSKTTEWKVATIWELIPKLGPTAKPATTLPQKGSRSESALSLFSKPLPPLPLA
ncbi:ras guanine nucleotide exchange factor domain-containing protein [Multifurca ochricompacta]|uniref:Ras guanine nucleotide exchange factor domain-containing protein n=1 Tax=Multifurca ochricompacta TaxID=376703 RepID=A0AAD4M9E9_9AGAM|nr:ras guanine nucleotide exchange factor domain-containing protein [Multifurca ochricompacta]